MPPLASIFLDFNLPNPTTWFYFSGLLAVALFFKFSRLLSMRNLDVLTLFLFMPGLLLLAQGNADDEKVRKIAEELRKPTKEVLEHDQSAQGDDARWWKKRAE